MNDCDCMFFSTEFQSYENYEMQCAMEPIMIEKIQSVGLEPGTDKLLSYWGSRLQCNKYSFHKKLELHLATNYSGRLLNRPLHISKADTKIFICGFQAKM